MTSWPQWNWGWICYSKTALISYKLEYSQKCFILAVWFNTVWEVSGGIHTMVGIPLVSAAVSMWPWGTQFIVAVDVRLHCSAISPADWAKHLKQRSNWVTLDTANKHCNSDDTKLIYTAGAAWCHRITLINSTTFPKNTVFHILFLEKHSNP